MENNNELEMGLFGVDSDLELNYTETPDGLEDTETPAEDETSETPEETPENINPNEEETPEDVVEDEVPEEGSGDDDTTSPNLFSSFASELHSKGVLPTLDLDKNEIQDTEGLVTAIKGQISNQVKDYLISKVGEEGYDALERGISLQQYQQHTNTLETLENITDDSLTQDLDLAKRVILQDYINQGLTESRAKRILQKTIDLGEEAVVEDAIESVTSLKTFEINRLEVEKEAAIERRKNEALHQEKIDNDLKNAIYSKKAFIENIPVNKTVQDKVYKAITEVVGQSPEGVMENKLMKDRRENPIEFDSKLYYLYEITNGFQDFSKLTTKATTKATSDFEKALRQTKFEDNGNPGFTVDKDSYDGLGSELVM